MIKCAAALSGNGVTAAIAHGTAEEWKKIIYAYGATMAKKFMMATSVWMDCYIRTERYIQVWNTRMFIASARVISYDKESGELVLHNYMV